MNKILKNICDKKLEEIELTKNKCSLKSLKKLLPDKKIEILKKNYKSLKIIKKIILLVKLKNQAQARELLLRIIIQKI